MRIKDTTSLPAGKMSETDEGFLLCRDVVLARVGTQDYGYWEVPQHLRDAKNARGVVTVHRDERDVFDPATVESFRGKAFTDDHPNDDVGPANYHQLMKGVIQNPRRGEGAHADHLVGDILVYDAGVIKKIRAGKREVSCGYDAKYEIADGKAYQRHIRGNHVSLVDQGRCGAECAIKDSGAAAGRRTTDMAGAFKKSKFMDALRGVFKAKDEDARAAAMEALEAELPDADDKDGDGEEGSDSDGDKANHHHVTVNIGGSMQGAEDKAKDRRARDADEDDEPTPIPEPEPNEDEPMSITKEDVAEAVTAAVEAATKPLIERIEELESAVEDVSDPDDEMTQDAVARAEVLAPGFQLPTFDSKPGSKAHRDAIVGMQRKVLTQAFATKDGMDAIRPLVATARPDFAKMPANELGVVFRGASAALASTNNTRQAPQYLHVVQDGAGKRGPLTQDAWNAMNKKHWEKLSASH